MIIITIIDSNVIVMIVIKVMMNITALMKMMTRIKSNDYIWYCSNDGKKSFLALYP